MIRSSIALEISIQTGRISFIARDLSRVMILISAAAIAARDIICRVVITKKMVSVFALIWRGIPYVPIWIVKQINSHLVLMVQQDTPTGILSNRKTVSH